MKKLAVENKVEMLTNYRVKSVFGADAISRVELENVKTNETKNIEVGAMFIAVGREPESNFIKNFVDVDAYGYVITDEEMRTNIKGVFACGDIRQKSLRQVITACSDGAVASTSAHNYIMGNN